MTKTHIGLRIEADLNDKLTKLAEADRRTFSDYVRGVLLEHVESKSK